MKKLFILLLAAALVGILISRTRNSGTAAEQAPAALAPEPAAQVAPAQAPKRDPAPGALPGVRLADARPEQPATPFPAPQPASSQHPALQAAAPSAAVGPAVPARAGDAENRPVALSATARPAASTATTVPADASFRSALDEAAALLKAGRNVEARAALTPLYFGSRGQAAARIREVLDRINAQLVFNPRCVEGAVIHVVKSGEVLTKVGKQYGVNWRMIQRVNGLPDDRINAGQKLKVLTGRPSAIVWKDEFRMALFLDGAYVKEYPVGIGRDDLTPVGEFVVDSMLIHEPWFKPGGGVVKYGEEGYLIGERWIGFVDEPGASGLGIHGTNDEPSIGTKCSNGCIRMRNADVIELYDFFINGTKVEVRE
jgi:lipoprotein-anchoring transpeptidase ErfK/SrfK